MILLSVSVDPLDVRPTIAELTEHVNVGIKWNQVGIQLKLETKELDAIDAEHKRVADKVSAMYKLWLETNPNASRKQSLEVLRLKSINEITLAKNYEDYIKSVTESITTQEEKKEETGEDGKLNLMLKFYYY